MTGTFRSLHGYNYRVWACGAIVSNIGTWMQRTAQDWLVLTQLTHNDATALGLVPALQFGPQVVLLPLTGYAADHIDRRKLLMVTQATMGLLALGLGVLTITGLVQLWQVYLFALLLGCATAFDSPARQTFVSELVGDTHLSNAVALNSTSFNLARMVGPAITGILIGVVGSGWVFLVNAASFAAVLCSLNLLRVSELHRHATVTRARGKLAEGFRYVWQRPELRVTLVMLFLVGTFMLNYPIYVSTMSVMVFHVGATQYGFLTSIMAIGSVTGALLSARRMQPRFNLLLLCCAMLGGAFGLAALMPNYGLFALTLMVIGISGQTFTTTAMSMVQLATEPALRGRVMAIMLSVALGGTAIGGPLVGRIADLFGARWALGVAALAGFIAALIGLRHRAKYQ